MTRWTLGWALVALSVAGCVTRGIGTGELSSPRTDRFLRLGSVSFRWKSDGPSPTQGNISAVTADGHRFTGRYREPTSILQAYEPTWRQKAGPTTQTFAVSEDPFFIGGVATDHVPRAYSGRLVADMQAADGSVMRCWFQLRRPSLGPAGGATGTCRLSNGTTIADASLSPAPSPRPAVYRVASQRPNAPACTGGPYAAPLGVPAVVIDDSSFQGAHP